MSPDQLAEVWSDIARLNRWINENTVYCATPNRCGGGEAVTTVGDLSLCRGCADTEQRWRAFEQRQATQ